ncbi:MAG TPA: hypothetical protein VGD68_06340 [Streptosporangiaceae bacterium]
MSVKAKIAAGAATFGLVGGGLAMAGTMTASAATPNCANNCAQIFSQKYGPQYLVDVYQARAAAGTPVILFQRSNSDPAEDFVIVDEGTVRHFYNNYGLVSSAFAHTYANDTAYEIQYEPYGLNSNFCLSTWPGETPAPGYLVRLEYCGSYSNSIWAADTDGTTAPVGSSVVTDHRSTGGFFSGAGTDVALINGATNSFSNPLVMNYPAGYPTDNPRPQLNVQPEKQYSNGVTFDNQEWGTVRGVAR